ncbi:MAG TPA: amidohydrolase family protein [Vicinamibacterales bacterium]|nr:amidohydrolase family protein [Vicinamibacterales bacterium]
MRRLCSVALILLSAAALAAQTPAKWDVNEPFGPATPVSFDTDEGTWMNLDVSPDGRTLVFDLMGDIYVMPAGGSGTSQARRLLGGPAFEMQPRFSPDGTRIAFSSDRGGLWNIWTMDVNGGDLKQVSREQRWFINSPTWAPDGRFIFARRHFVSTRSLGAGEVWMYHASGSDGLQVTEKVSFQKDQGEPAISPDGRYLYYSKDVTPGQNFEYNKDPHGLIYAVIRRDLRTGQERTFVARPGGSITPRPSPDGKHLAFIRRVDLKSHLFLKDLNSGEEWSIFDRLDKDLQEAWAVLGVYAQYAWSPDSRFIYIWGEGKIWKVDVAKKAGVQVPFTARVEQSLNTPVRFPVVVHADRFQVRMLRDVSVSPDGSTVAYNALGRLYVQKIGAAEAAVAAGGGSDLSAAWIVSASAFSPDGRSIVYAAWHDTEGGRIRVSGVDGSNTRDITKERGHYTDPSFSADGRWIAYRKTGGDLTRGITFGLDSGLYVARADGSGEPRLVREGGINPRFNKDGTRLFFNDGRNNNFVLASVDLDGSDERVHLQSPNATSIVPSPDERWVAFIERFQTYVAEFPVTGRTVDIGPRTGAFPVARISRDSGWYLQWSPDSTRVYWTQGPELFTRELSRTFTFLGQGLEKADEPESKGRPIGFMAQADTPQGTLALTGARIITMANGGRDSQSVIENGTIIVDGNRITAIGPAASVSIPGGARRIDVAGRTIIPGLIDAHAHVGGESNGILARHSWPLMANLAFGVTTMHDPSNDTETVFTNAEMIRAGLKIGPRLFSTGTILYGAETPFKAVVENYDDALFHVRRLKAAGAISVKSYNQQRRDSRQMIIKAAREEQMMVVPEGGSLYYQNATHVLDGHTSVEHNIPVPVLYKDVLTVYGRSGVAYTPTLVVGYGGLSGEFYWYQESNVWENERLLQFVPRDVIVPRSRRRAMAAEDDYNHILLAKGAKQLMDAGALVNMGAHGQMHGIAAHWEMWMMHQGGMSSMEALRTATLNPALTLGMEKDLGSIEVGKLADLVVLDRNPLENIRHTEGVRMVMINGRLYDHDLNEIGARERKRAPFWWAR